MHPLSRRAPRAAQARARRRGKPPGLRDSDMAERAASEKAGRTEKAHHGSQQRQRQKGVRARVTPDEYTAIEKRARAAGLSTAAYLRACALGDKGPRSQRRPPVELEQFGKAIAELNKIGSNVNQIAHAVNLGKDPDRILLRRLAEELSSAVSALLGAAGLA